MFCAQVMEAADDGDVFDEGSEGSEEGLEASGPDINESEEFITLEDTDEVEEPDQQQKHFCYDVSLVIASGECNFFETVAAAPPAPVPLQPPGKGRTSSRSVVKPVVIPDIRLEPEQRVKLFTIPLPTVSITAFRGTVEPGVDTSLSHGRLAPSHLGQACL